MTIKPVIAICEGWEKKYEESQRLNSNTFNRICSRQDSLFMDIDDNPPSIQSKPLLTQYNKKKKN